MKGTFLFFFLKFGLVGLIMGVGTAIRKSGVSPELCRNCESRQIAKGQSCRTSQKTGGFKYPEQEKKMTPEIVASTSVGLPEQVGFGFSDGFLAYWTVQRAQEVVRGYWLKREEEDLQELARKQISLLLGDPQTGPFVLRESGFDMEQQLGVWIKEFIFARARGESFGEAKERALGKTVEDIRGFHWEYLEKRLAVPIFVRFKEVAGQPRVVADKYDNCFYEEIVSSAEREGVVKKTVEEIVAILPHLRPGSMLVMTSPPGWSGLSNPHPYSQTYVFRINAWGGLTGVMLRSGMSLAESEAFLVLLGRKKEDFSGFLSGKKRIKRAVENFVVLEKGDFGHLVETIREVRSSPFLVIDKTVGRDGRVKEIKPRGYDELYQQLEAVENLYLLEKQAEAIIDDFKVWAREKINDLSADSFRELVIRMGRTIIRLSRARRYFEAQGFQRRKKGLLPPWAFDPRTLADLRREAESIEMLGGCNGGGGLDLLGLGGARKNAEGKRELKCCGLWVEVGSHCPICGKLVV